MKKLLSLVAALLGITSMAAGVACKTWSHEGDFAQQDIALVLLSGKYCDPQQRNFIKRFAEGEAFSFFEYIENQAGDVAGDYQLKQASKRRVYWDTLTELEACKQSFDDVVRLVGKKLQTFSSQGAKSVALVLPAALTDAFGPQVDVMQQLGVTVALADHAFTYATQSKAGGLERVDVVVSQEAASSAQDALATGSLIGYYTNLARRWGEEPPCKLTPQVWAQEAAWEAGIAGCRATVLDVNKIRELGMGGVLGVGSGAAHAPKVLVLEYTPAAPLATVALVGKGILFDSGGLQIKSSGGMLDMKYDKCGGAAALAACLAAARLKAPVRVVAVVPAVYNKTGSDAMHPRDVLHMMNGKTVEVLNTDAEGRLILADALHYAEKFYQPDLIIDLATLTGACVAGLGCGIAALMSRDQRLASDLIAAGGVVGERLCQLPLEKLYQPAIKSPMADVANLGRAGYGAGAIMAGLFLEHFVEKTPWVHLDIAGPAAESPTTWYEPAGATGFGVRLLVEYLLNYRLDRCS